MHRTWRTESYVTRGAQVLSHQNIYIYTLHYSTVQYIASQYIIRQNIFCINWKKKKKHNQKHRALYLYLLFNCFKCLYINRRIKKKITYFFCFFWRWAQVLSYQFFQRLARGLRPNDGVAQQGPQYGSTTGKHNGKQQRKIKSEKKKQKNRFSIYLTALK